MKLCARGFVNDHIISKIILEWNVWWAQCHTYRNLTIKRKDIASQYWDQIYNSTDPNDMWLNWKCSFLSIVDKHASLRTMSARRRSSPWITSELKKRMHDRDILKMKASKSNDSSAW